MTQRQLPPPLPGQEGGGVPSGGTEVTYLRGDRTWHTPQGGGGPTGLDDLTDVTLTTPTNDEALCYDSVAGKWVNKTVSGTGGGHSYFPNGW